MRNNLKPLILGTLLMSGCSWVELRPEAVDVSVVTSDAVEQCSYKGIVQAQTKASVGFYERSAETIQKELTTLARNQAAVLGANRLVPDSVINTDGSQRFKSYLCP